MFTFLCIYSYSHICTQSLIFTYIYIHIYMYVSTHNYPVSACHYGWHTCLYVCVWMYIYVFLECMCTYIYIYIRTRRICAWRLSGWSRLMARRIANWAMSTRYLFCSVLQCVAVWCSVVRRIAVCCNVLQCFTYGMHTCVHIQ